MDLATVAGQVVVSPLDGTAVNFKGSKTGHPMVDITPADNLDGVQMIRILYVEPSAATTLNRPYRVIAGQPIGTAAELGKLKYPDTVTPHIHVQIRRDGHWVDPGPYFGF